MRINDNIRPIICNKYEMKSFIRVSNEIGDTGSSLREVAGVSIRDNFLEKGKNLSSYWSIVGQKGFFSIV